MPHYYMFHKPFGCVTARRDDRYPTVMDYFKELHNDRLSPVGRLDRETTGLLLITDDGPLAHELLSPKKHVDKTYYAKVSGKVTEEDVVKLAEGVDIGEKDLTRPARLEILSTCNRTCGNVRYSFHTAGRNPERYPQKPSGSPHHLWDNYHFRREETTDPAHDEVCSLLCDRIKTYFHRRHCT